MMKYLNKLTVLAIMLSPTLSWGIVNIGDDIELEGFIQAQSIMRNGPSIFHDGELTSQRNTAQLEGKYYFGREGEAFGLNTGLIEEMTFTFLARAAHDSAFDVKDSYGILDGRGKEEYKVREAFLDFVMPPFTLRLGRQQVVWGETDNFRALDVINPLDRTWHGTRESWEDIRIPLWMARGIWDIGKIGPFEETFLEVIFNPYDFKSNKVGVDWPRPWAFNGIGLKVPANSIDLGPDGIVPLSVTVLDGEPDRKLSNAQGGFRFKGIYGDVEFSANYFYGFSQTPGVKVRSAVPIGPALAPTSFETVVQLEYPRTHVLGFTANYSEEKYTQSVIRLETSLTKGIPVSIASSAPANIDSNKDGFETDIQSVVMIGVDRPTWIKSLNELRTFFISTQFFWRRYLDHNDFYRGGFYEVSAVPGMPGSYVSKNEDRLDQDEFIFTFSASTSYGRAGLWKPLFVFAYDPRSTGAYNQIKMEYLFSKHLVFKFEQHLYWRAGGDDQSPWGLGSYLAEPGHRRNETVFTVTYQF
jgi:hypothetical protein